MQTARRCLAGSRFRRKGEQRISLTNAKAISSPSCASATPKELRPASDCRPRPARNTHLKDWRGRINALPASRWPGLTPAPQRHSPAPNGKNGRRSQGVHPDGSSIRGRWGAGFIASQGGAFAAMQRISRVRERHTASRRAIAGSVGPISNVPQRRSQAAAPAVPARRTARSRIRGPNPVPQPHSWGFPRQRSRPAVDGGLENGAPSVAPFHGASRC
jgi:hypothetical protein